MGICSSCCKNTDIEGQPHYEEEKGEKDRLDHGDEEAVEGHEEGDALVHHDVHHDVHHHLRLGQSRKELCRRCNLRLLTLIHVPPKRDAPDDDEEDKKDKNDKMEKMKIDEITGEPSSTSGSNDTILQISRADDSVENVEHKLKKPRKPHRDLHVSWRKGHGDFIDHLMFGWHH